MSSAPAFAKINLALVVGRLRSDGKHEVATILQRIDLCDVVQIEPAPNPGVRLEGFPEDTLVTSALQWLAGATGTRPRWNVSLEKRIPVSAGLGGGSSDAATALELANALEADPLSRRELAALGARVGTDVPFFLTGSPMLGLGDGTELLPLQLPQDFVVLLVLPDGERKESTADVYRSFDEREGALGFEARRRALFETLTRIERTGDLAELPRNDLASSPLASELEAMGAFRADVTGAGPAVYALFEREQDAVRAADAVLPSQTWLARPRAVRQPYGLAN
jgi:4-diphosphocytidyl-2-C-methyl-D-erythritol kinase